MPGVPGTRLSLAMQSRAEVCVGISGARQMEIREWHSSEVFVGTCDCSQQA